MNDKRIYYSCCTWLCYEICQHFYGALHYVWCTPYFDPPSRLNQPNHVPPTSNPREIYWNLRKEVEAGDQHSLKVGRNRDGILSGAKAKFEQGAIDAAQYKQISDMVLSAHLIEFRPMILVIPGEPVISMLRQVPWNDRASRWSEEYIIDRLPRQLFDAIEL